MTIKLKNKKPVVVALILSILAVPSIYVIKLEREIQTLRNQVLMNRILAPGRTKAEIIRWMGNPDMIRTDIELADGRETKAVLIYRDGIFAEGKINGNENIWVALDKQDRIISIYNPAYPQDRDCFQNR